MKNIPLVLICCIYFQVVGQRDLSVTIRDVNTDGIEDTIRSYYDGGSSFGGKFVTLTNGRSNEVFKMDSYGCYCAIKSTIVFPESLNKKENISFLEVMKKELLPVEKPFPDPSLDWILQGMHSHKTLKKDSFFDLIIHPKIQWNTNKITLPDVYYITITGDTLTALNNSTNSLKKTAKGVLIYYAHNHYRSIANDSLQLVATNDLYEIYKTSHGVIAKKEDSHKWIFISDVDLTGAPQKLRWESIKHIKLISTYIILEQRLMPDITHNLYVINIETGIAGRLKLVNYDMMEKDDIDSLMINEESITYTINGKKEIFRMTDIFKKLETHYLTK
ncbi:hypothetical protein [Aquimarina sp. RZ0]|uniref:hypothetical protein n=1 Tax=Aquimarina sp. RZ0 TaxID=2607730 RepID=UPI0011F10F64|nr:hypothetical protein [Aquimarina sp. RZ0]KAA1246789.1 hypothetical protein F0000_05885 [Aquimarina sp. RZ0]